MTEQRTLQAPETNAENEAFWQAAENRQLMIGTCKSCGEAHFYPRAICPHCFSDATELRSSAGKGTIYSFSIARRAPQPYAIAYVTLDEGPTIMTNIVQSAFDDIAIGQSVELVFQASDNGSLIPVFKRA